MLLSVPGGHLNEVTKRKINMNRRVTVELILIALIIIVGALAIAFLHSDTMFINVLVDTVSGVIGFVLGYLQNNKAK
jgi:hypothetical protein